jgi:hypothetical protein
MRRRLPTILTILLLAASPPAPATAAETAWTAVTPALARPDNYTSAGVSDVAAVSPTDVWTVGGGWGENDGSQNLIAHWSGAGWRQVVAPAAPSVVYRLSALDAVSARDVWAVGNTLPSWNIPSTTVIAHYDGTAWSFAPVPPAQPANSYVLTDVDMVSATDGWAVGWRGGPPTEKLEIAPLMMRWQNGRWGTVTLPDLDGADVTLQHLHVRSGNDVWAVGNQGDTALVVHFDGTRWSRIDVPRVDGDVLWSVTAVSAGDVWAVGTSCVWDGVGTCKPLVLHLSGGVWRVVPTTGDGGTHLVDVVARSANDVWVVGYGISPSGYESNHVEHWDGRRFTLVPADAGLFAAQGGLASALEAVTRIPGTTEVWAVGWQDSDPQVIRHN